MIYDLSVIHTNAVKLSASNNNYPVPAIRSRIHYKYGSTLGGWLCLYQECSNYGIWFTHQILALVK